MIFNTFTIRNSNMDEAKKLLKDKSVDRDLLFMDFKKHEDELSNISYKLIGWGCEDYKILKDKKVVHIDIYLEDDIRIFNFEYDYYIDIDELL